MRPSSAYVRALVPALGPETFRPATSRLLWLPVHLAILALSTVAIARGWVPWPAKLALSILMGVSFAGTTFLAHETLHGAITHDRTLGRLVAWIGFFPFVVSPRLWVAWHNRVHHAHANQPDLDPDAFPTLAAYRESTRQRWVTDLFAPGGGRWLGLTGLLLGFTIQTVSVLFFAGKRAYLTPSEHRRAIAETALGVCLWITIGALVGPVAFLWVFLVPVLVANAIVMSHIFTNHSLSPHVATDDPLIHSLSVTTPRFVSWITLGFGFHVEHHIFPWISTRHAPRVRDLIQARWPGRYQSMPLGRALVALHRRARVYKDERTLFDPRTGREWPTLGSEEAVPGPSS